MQIHAARRVFIRLWLVFVVIWSLIFGYQFYSTRAAYNAAHNEAQIARVGGNIEGALGSPPAYDDPITGGGAVQRRERVERTTKASADRALLLLLGGLVAGTLLIGAAYWVTAGAADRNQSA